MATISQTYTFVAGAIPTAAQWNSNWTTVINAINGNLDANNVDTSAVATLATANTWTADQTFNDSVKVTLGSGGDADLYYDGTDVVLNTAVFGTGDFVVTGGSIELDDSEGVTLGTGKDATLQYDGTNVVLTTDAVGTGVLVVSNDIRSDTDSTDDLGSTSVRWANLYVDDITLTTTITAGTSVVANTMTLATGSITDTTGAISFGNENLTTTGTLNAGATTVSSLTTGGTIVSDTTNTDDIGTSSVFFRTGYFQSGWQHPLRIGACRLWEDATNGRLMYKYNSDPVSETDGNEFMVG